MTGISRTEWQGVWSIVRFNWPFYLAAGLVLAASLLLIPLGGITGMAALAAGLGSLWFLAGSLGVSWWVYDHSDLYRFGWITRLIQENPSGRIVLCHAGFDDLSPHLKARFPSARWTVLDHYDPAVMTEASIRRARKLYPPPAGTLAAPWHHWPVADQSADLVLGLLAIHELRRHSGRVAWFREARRCLAPGGRVILVEHVRDAANFLAFGPGFFHFHSVMAWQRSWQEAELVCRETFRLTPFLRVFVLGAASSESP